MFCIRKCSHNRKTNFKGGIKMKKFFAMTMCVIMLFGLVACGDGDPEATFPSGGVFTTRPAETETMSRDDAVEAVEEYYENVVRRTGGYSYLVAPNVVLDDNECVMTVFVVDNCGDMTEKQLSKLCTAMLATRLVIASGNYVGLVYYDADPSIELPVTKWSEGVDIEYASIVGCMEDENGNSGSSMFDAIIVGLKMLTDAQEYVPHAKLRLIVLSNGRLDERCRNKIEEIIPLAVGLGAQIHTVAYDVADGDYKRLDGMKKISEDTGAECLEVNTSDVVEKVLRLAQEVCNK